MSFSEFPPSDDEGGAPVEQETDEDAALRMELVKLLLGYATNHWNPNQRLNDDA